MLGLTGRINGRWASEELNPYWFNTELVEAFSMSREAGERVAWPEICIELFLSDRDELQHLSGANNTETPTRACPGVTLRVAPNPEYRDELEQWASSPSGLLPVEYYKVDWRSFADHVLTGRPRALVTALIDSRTLRSSSGVDYHMREILRDQLDAAERAAMSLAYREVKAAMTDGALKPINERMAEAHKALHDQPIGLAMDQTTRTSWEGAVTPQVREIPFSMSGQGQQAAIKISLAMRRHADRASFVMIEEPENHLTFASLGVLLGRMEQLAGENQQLFVATHSSFVLNRLGLDAIHLLSAGRTRKFPGPSVATVKYFQKLPGYDTLRMVLADRVVLVEGPSDEIIFERIFRDLFDRRPIEAGIDVLSVRGLSFPRCLELCSALEKTVAVVRDNDGHDPSELRSELEEWLVGGTQEAFIGDPEHGATLEPQLIHVNGVETLRGLLGISDRADVEKWMTRQKTERPSGSRPRRAKSIRPTTFVRPPSSSVANQLTLAVAGSGKTQGLAEYCAGLPRTTRILALTFTQMNQGELRQRISSVAGDHPSMEVLGWYAFLIRDFARPFLPFKFPDERIRGFNFQGRPHRFARGVKRFLDADGAAYACELGRLAHELTEASGGSLRRRLECCYDEILIDEVQDFAAHDWEILDFLLGSTVSIKMVGDFRQAVLSTNPRSSKNRQYAHVAALEWFREREEEGLLEIETSSVTWRCRPEIAQFSDNIYGSEGSFPATTSKNDRTTGHDGVFWVHPDDAAAYVERFKPRCLRDSVKSGTSFDFDYLNFGLAKGAAYDRVLVVPTSPIGKFVQRGNDLKPQSAAKFYVAVTRAAQSVAIVLDSPGGSEIPQWRPDE